ncbi:uncharacterized protein LOC117292597 isoform X2 [Asterias rubens]|nr:uncharacterized protein LOC117292597 isoform X2 [Asterias rubens]XP_033630599.1 uncharacterized protein LOC117292597 isoform X2 [Asterias rubens]
MVGYNINGAKRKRALLLHYGGEQLETVFDTLSDTGDENDYEKAIEALTAHFVPNPLHETIIFFRSLKQNPEENVDQFCTRLRNAAEKCEFGDLNRQLIIQFSIGCSSIELRREALDNILVEKACNLPQLLDFTQSLELSNKQADAVQNQTDIQQNPDKLSQSQTQHIGDKPTRHESKDQGVLYDESRHKPLYDSTKNRPTQQNGNSATPVSVSTSKQLLHKNGQSKKAKFNPELEKEILQSYEEFKDRSYMATAINIRRNSANLADFTPLQLSDKIRRLVNNKKDQKKTSRTRRASRKISDDELEFIREQCNDEPKNSELFS